MVKSERKKIIVALSGGVDSAVSAALLKKQGYEVIGVFFDFGEWENFSRVKTIAKKLDIPLKKIKARKRFRQKIVDYFINCYKSGITPNPCVLCNKEMKFALLFELLRQEKADYVATGHYARICQGAYNTKNDTNFKKGKKLSHPAPYRLYEAVDETKDQSYFLYRLTQKELSRTIFPLGILKKTDVKKIAKKLGLPVASRESQDVCFLIGKDLNLFLKKYIKPKRGNILSETGEVVGRHRGLPFYTIGQRRGIEIGPSRSRQMRDAIQSIGAGPYFVIGKNPRKNELTISNDSKKLLTGEFKVEQVSWVSRNAKSNLRADTQIRYHAPKFSAIIKKTKGGNWEAKSKKPFRAVTPGQSAVFFRKNEILGGGIITKTKQNEYPGRISKSRAKRR